MDIVIEYESDGKFQGGNGLKKCRRYGRMELENIRRKVEKKKYHG